MFTHRIRILRALTTASTPPLGEERLGSPRGGGADAQIPETSVARDFSHRSGPRPSQPTTASKASLGSMPLHPPSVASIVAVDASPTVSSPRRSPRRRDDTCSPLCGTRAHSSPSTRTFTISLFPVLRCASCHQDSRPTKRLMSAKFPKLVPGARAKRSPSLDVHLALLQRIPRVHVRVTLGARAPQHTILKHRRVVLGLAPLPRLVARASLARAASFAELAVERVHPRPILLSTSLRRRDALMRTGTMRRETRRASVVGRSVGRASHRDARRA